MKKIKIIGLLTILILTLSYTGCSNKKDVSSEKITKVVSMDYNNFKNIKELKTASNLIVKGVIINSRIKEIDDYIDESQNSRNKMENPGGSKKEESPNLYTVYTVKVSECYKGDSKKNSTIEFKQIGGENDKVKYLLEDSIDFKKNKEYVLFLETYDDCPASLLNPIQSTYTISSDTKNNTRISNKNKGVSFDNAELDNVEKFESVCKENDLTLTVKDLKN